MPNEFMKCDYLLMCNRSHSISPSFPDIVEKEDQYEPYILLVFDKANISTIALCIPSKESLLRFFCSAMIILSGYSLSSKYSISLSSVARKNIILLFSSIFSSILSINNSIGLLAIAVSLSVLLMCNPITSLY